MALVDCTLRRLDNPCHRRSASDRAPTRAVIPRFNACKWELEAITCRGAVLQCDLVVQLWLTSRQPRGHPCATSGTVVIETADDFALSAEGRRRGRRERLQPSQNGLCEVGVAVIIRVTIPTGLLVAPPRTRLIRLRCSKCAAGVRDLCPPLCRPTHPSEDVDGRRGQVCSADVCVGSFFSAHSSLELGKVSEQQAERSGKRGQSAPA